MKNIVYIVVIVCMVTATLGLAADIDGVWMGIIETPRGEIEFTLNLQADGESLTGAISGFGDESPIQNGVYRDNRITFETERNGNLVSNEGSLSGNTLFLYLGPWETEVICERQEDNTPDITGTWVGTMTSPQGDMELTFNINTNKEPFSGTVVSMMGEYPLSNTKQDGKHFSFDVDANGMQIPHDCTLQDDGTVLMKFTVMDMQDELVLKRK